MRLRSAGHCPDVANIHVLGMDEDNLEILRRLPDPSWTFHGLLAKEDLVGVLDLDVPGLLDRARQQLDAAEPPPDAIVGYWDFPVSSMVPILCRERGLASASLESVLRCEHKYWSRLEQAKVTDDLPGFGLVDLARDGTAAGLPDGVSFPAWVKPVKSAASALAFRVEDEAGLEAALREIADGIGTLGRPFDDVLSLVDLPPEIAEAGAMAVLAEDEATGHMVTVEGYEHHGRVEVHGVIDSLTYPGGSSFRRFQYPSRVPGPVQLRMVDITTRVIRRLGLTSTTFNVEYFWDEETDRLTLLEVNPRHAQSHAWLFEQVDGITNHESVVALALGQRPVLPCHRGPRRLAAKCQVRRFRDGVVRSVPDRDRLARIEREIGSVHLRVLVEAGARLSALPLQEPFSYELAQVFVAADDEAELVATYRRAVEAMGIVVDHDPEAGLRPYWQLALP